ncbi:MAG: HAMP domain-containing sensor histidine kinase [Patescibacteria group bacterium]
MAEKKIISTTGQNQATDQTNNSSSTDVKGDFITIASHQLRTPIAAIRWSLDTLLSGRAGVLSDKQREVVNEAYQNNKFMVKVVNDLLRVTRLEEKGVSLSPQYTSLLKLTKEVINQHNDLAKASNCEIILKSENDLPKVFIDPVQVKPVIDTLVDNAIRYTNKKSTIVISLKKANDFLQLSIKDSGIGISANQQNLIFSKFFRAENAMKLQTEGLGLNLYLAKKIIEASGGKISFVSQENKGSTFSLYLPINKDQVNINGTVDKDDPENILKKEREFVSITVHELKAPLGITKWSSEMLKSKKPGELNSEQLELVDQIYRGNERLLVLVRDLLNLSKLQEGKFEIEAKLIQFEDIVSDVVNGFTVEAQRKKIALVWDKPKATLPKISADPNRIAQVATNLISNAIKYTPDNGQVVVTMAKMTSKDLKDINSKSAVVNISFVDNKNGYLVLAVKDTGIGISIEDQKKLFTRFFRSKKVLKSETEGTGLGLYITKSIVNLHKGDIWFSSDLGKGSTFYLSLPIA